MAEVFAVGVLLEQLLMIVVPMELLVLLLTLEVMWLFQLSLVEVGLSLFL